MVSLGAIWRPGGDVIRDLPTGTVTFLFSDIEGSTRLATLLGIDRWRTVLETHHGLLRAAFEAHGGVVVSTEGDSFFAVFSSAIEAIAAAVAAQRALGGTDWPPEAGSGGLQVRIGLHTGEGRLGGDSYVGLDVHRAARIASAANGSQTILSASTRSLVQSGLPDRVTLADLGRHRLKDLDQPETLSRLVIGDLADDPRPPRTLETPTNLPAELTSFIGRGREVAEVVQLIRAVRLVTLTGPGGTGKTRLSLAAAAVLLPDVPDGVFFVPLAAITDPDLVATSILAALSIKQEPGTDDEQVLRDHLRDRRMLLVLDNFEQVAAAAPLVGRLVAAAPDLRVMTTSREVLHLKGEHEVPVQPLALPDPEIASNDPAGLAEVEAIALFLARARTTVPGFAMTPDNAAAILRICARLDGLPLAIELAAARVKLLSPEAILDRLGRDLSILSSAERDVPERQRTLRGAIAWSYDLLDPAERTLFRQAAVFVDGWTLEAVEAVCDPTGELGLEKLEAIASLVDKSLVRSEPTTHGEPRFRYLATIRAYGLERLEEAGEAVDLRRRHALHFAGVAAVESRHLAGPDVVRAVDRLELELANLRAAVSWSLDAAEPGVGLRIIGWAWRFWYQGGHLTEGRAAIEDLLRHPAAAGRTRDRAIGLNGAGGICYWLGDFDAAADWWTEAMSISQELNDAPGIAEGHYNLGYIAMIRGDPSTQRSHHAAALALYEALGDDEGMINAREGLIPALFVEGDLAGAEALLQQTIVVQRARRDPARLGQDLGLLGTIQAKAGRLEDARRSVQEALVIVNEGGTLTSVASTLSGAALIEAEDGRPDRAATIAGALDALTERSGIVVAEVAMLGLPTAAEEARSRLDPETFETAYERGRSMNRSAIVAYALAGLERSADDGARH